MRYRYTHRSRKSSATITLKVRESSLMASKRTRTKTTERVKRLDERAKRSDERTTRPNLPRTEPIRSW